jgi:hypothetical protein
VFELNAEERRLAKRVDWVDAAPGIPICARYVRGYGYVRGEDRDPPE